MTAHLKRKQFFAAAFVMFCGWGLGSGPEASAVRLEAGLDYPTVLGSMSQNFSSNLGGATSFYLEPLFDPRINNFISIQYASFTVLADQKTSYRVIPVLAAIELPGRVFSDLQTTVAFGVGGAFAYLNIANAASMRGYGFFAAQIKPGVLWDVSPDFSLYARTPVTFLVGSKSLNYLAYSVGAQIKL